MRIIFEIQGYFFRFRFFSFLNEKSEKIGTNTDHTFMNLNFLAESTVLSTAYLRKLIRHNQSPQPLPSAPGIRTFEDFYVILEHFQEIG